MAFPFSENVRFMSSGTACHPRKDDLSYRTVLCILECIGNIPGLHPLESGCVSQG